MSVHIKFKAAKDFDSIALDGENISVLDLKKLIVAKKKLGKNFGVDYDLIITNSLTNEDYRDESTLIPKNTSLVVARLPISIHRSMLHNGPNSGGVTQLSTPPPPAPLIINTGTTGGDDSSNDPLTSEQNESAKINALIQQSHASVPSKYAPGPMGGGFHFNKHHHHGGGGYHQNMSNGNHYHPLQPITIMASTNNNQPQQPTEIKIPHANYICYRCNQPGHFIQQCPTNGDPKFDHHKMKKASGIPKTFLKPLNAQLNSQSNSTTGPSTVLLPHGGVAVVMQNETEFTRLAKAISLEEEYKKKQLSKDGDTISPPLKSSSPTRAPLNGNTDLKNTEQFLNESTTTTTSTTTSDNSNGNSTTPSKKRSLDDANSPIITGDGRDRSSSPSNDTDYNNKYNRNSNNNNSSDINKRLKYTEPSSHSGADGNRQNKERESRQQYSDFNDSRDNRENSRDSSKDSYSGNNRDSRDNYNRDYPRDSYRDNRDHNRDSRDNRDYRDSRDSSRDSRDNYNRDYRDSRDNRDSRDYHRRDSRDSHRERDTNKYDSRYSSSSSSSSYRGGKDRR
ncbi:hypothetical protein DLAC_04426 [Tieghemostelium lacteum]|uniref:CCHC-type domain-containing protein n=1 Tax=Tieghemostelium lacteum TaxID=361077 RepID=A0A151ZJT1_TIELA|nr:hypothetical protein DLAC_04426 [Tieghemostelium lacteum]|eukprot:KYQ94140.1 hypothetical protein DLAC_04426 [Tieghemostelium lacteum]